MIHSSMGFYCYVLGVSFSAAENYIQHNNFQFGSVYKNQELLEAQTVTGSNSESEHLVTMTNFWWKWLILGCFIHRGIP